MDGRPRGPEARKAVAKSRPLQRRLHPYQRPGGAPPRGHGSRPPWHQGRQVQFKEGAHRPPAQEEKRAPPSRKRPAPGSSHGGDKGPSRKRRKIKRDRRGKQSAREKRKEARRQRKKRKERKEKRKRSRARPPGPLVRAAGGSHLACTEEEEEEDILDEETFRICKERMRPTKAALRRLEKPARGLPLVERLEQTRNALLQVGDRIAECLLAHSDRDDARLWRTNLWTFVAKFTDFDARRLHRVYKMACKERAREEERKQRRQQEEKGTAAEQDPSRPESSGSS